MLACLDIDTGTRVHSSTLEYATGIGVQCIHVVRLQSPKSKVQTGLEYGTRVVHVYPWLGKQLTYLLQLTFHSDIRTVLIAAVPDRYRYIHHTSYSSSIAIPILATDTRVLKYCNTYTG